MFSFNLLLCTSVWLTSLLFNHIFGLTIFGQITFRYSTFAQSKETLKVYSKLSFFCDQWLYESLYQMTYCKRMKCWFKSYTNIDIRFSLSSIAICHSMKIALLVWREARDWPNLINSSANHSFGDRINAVLYILIILSVELCNHCGGKTVELINRNQRDRIRGLALCGQWMMAKIMNSDNYDHNV